MSEKFLYTIDELVAATGGKLLGKAINGVTDISIDSRTLTAGACFFAIKGETFDGHQFIESAIKNSAAICVVEKHKLPNINIVGATFLVVENVLRALENLAKFSRQRSSAKIIAITGSAGKTTIKEMVKLALNKNEAAFASPASFNNHWGVPLSLARMGIEIKHAIFEIGMNHAGEITPLVKMVRPHVVLINNVAPVHLAAFNNVEEIAYAKAEIFNGLEKNGTAVLNKDNEYFSLLKKIAKEKQIKNILTFGIDKESDSCLQNIESNSLLAKVKIKLAEKTYQFSLNMQGEHMAKNASAVLAILHGCGADIPSAISQLESMRPVEGRGRRYELQKANGSFIFIDESYNANPISMKSAIDLLGETATKGKRIAVLGDMLELGKDSQKFHTDLKKCLVENKIDKIFLAGKNMLALHNILKNSVYGETIKHLINDIKDSIDENDVVMAKASFSMQFAKLVAELLATYKQKK